MCNKKSLKKISIEAVDAIEFDSDENGNDPETEEPNVSGMDPNNLASSSSELSSDDENSDNSSNFAEEVEEGNGSEENSSPEDEEVSEENSENEDDLSAAIKLCRMKSKKDAPPQIEHESVFVDLSFHPGTNILAVVDLEGDIILYKYDKDSVENINTFEVHSRACRTVDFSEDGNTIFTSSRDKSIVVTDTETGKFKNYFGDAHESPLYSMCIINEHIFASGDEDGVVKLWDIRHKEPFFTLSDTIKDYVSSMVTTERKKFLACTSGDGFITSINMLARKLHAESEGYKSEYTCSGLIHNEAKLVVGTASGNLVFYNWGEFGLHCDDYPGPNKKGINCMVPVSENIIVTGWADGQIRATYLFPNKCLGIVGQHQVSVDAMDISFDGKYLASTSLDMKISFWPISFFNEFDFSAVNAKRNLPSSQYADRASFFADLADDSAV